MMSYVCTCVNCGDKMYQNKESGRYYVETHEGIEFTDEAKWNTIALRFRPNTVYAGDLCPGCSMLGIDVFAKIVPYHQVPENCVSIRV